MIKEHYQDIDSKIKKCLKDECDKVSVPGDMFFKIRNEILRKEERGVFNMKYKFLRPKTALIAGIICVLTTVTCVAATNLSGWYSSSSILTETTVFPDEDEVREKVGFEPKYVKEFSNGFKFKSFNYSSGEMKDEKGQVYEENKSADFEYTRDDSEKNQHMTISASKLDDKYLGHETSNVKKEIYKGIEIGYTSAKYKSVSEGYEPTEEEKELCDKGLLQIGYGADGIDEDNTQYVSWYEDGMLYSIMNFNYDELTENDMINMAKEIIDVK